MNQLDTNQKIYQDKSVFELVSEVYEGIVEVGKNESGNKPVSKELKEKIGVLYYTKELNSPYFFSIQFSIGVYLPFLSPVVFPLLITFFSYLKEKRKNRNKSHTAWYLQ